jgi:hypothetical protein
VVVRFGAITLSASPVSRLGDVDDERRQAKRNSLADKLTVEAKALADLKVEKAAVDGERRTVGLTCHDKIDHLTLGARWLSCPSRVPREGKEVQSFGARKGVTPMTKLLMKPENPISG